MQDFLRTVALDLARKMGAPMDNIGPMLQHCPIEKLDRYVPLIMEAGKTRRWADLALESKLYHA